MRVHGDHGSTAGQPAERLERRGQRGHSASVSPLGAGHKPFTGSCRGHPGSHARHRFDGARPSHLLLDRACSLRCQVPIIRPAERLCGRGRVEEARLAGSADRAAFGEPTTLPSTTCRCRCPAFPGRLERVLEPLGRSLFNQHCAHCHAPNTMSPKPSRDLRRLKLRYGVKMTETAYAAITVARRPGRSSWTTTGSGTS